MTFVINQAGAEPVRGISAYRAMMEAQYGAFPDWHVVLDDQFATDDRVACRWRVSGTHSGDGLGFPATGRRVEYAGMSVWEFEDGKARRGRTFRRRALADGTAHRAHRDSQLNVQASRK
jgi:steroid delta-isomerase-like uncharacterized protein